MNEQEPIIDTKVKAKSVVIRRGMPSSSGGLYVEENNSMAVALIKLVSPEVGTLIKHAIHVVFHRRRELGISESGTFYPLPMID